MKASEKYWTNEWANDSFFIYEKKICFLETQGHSFSMVDRIIYVVTTDVKWFVIQIWIYFVWLSV